MKTLINISSRRILIDDDSSHCDWRGIKNIMFPCVPSFVSAREVNEFARDFFFAIIADIYKEYRKGKRGHTGNPLKSRLIVKRMCKSAVWHLEGDFGLAVALAHLIKEYGGQVVCDSAEKTMINPVETLVASIKWRQV